MAHFLKVHFKPRKPGSRWETFELQSPSHLGSFQRDDRLNLVIGGKRLAGIVDFVETDLVISGDQISGCKTLLHLLEPDGPL